MLGCKDVDLYMIEITAVNSCLQHTTFQNSTLEKYSCSRSRVKDGRREGGHHAHGADRLGILMCGEGATALRMEYTLMNPNGEHLGTGYIRSRPRIGRLRCFGASVFIVQTYYNLVWHHGHDGTAQAVLGAPYRRSCTKWWACSAGRRFPATVPSRVGRTHQTATISLNEASTYFIMVLIARVAGDASDVTRQRSTIDRDRGDTSVRVEPDVPVLR